MLPGPRAFVVLVPLIANSLRNIVLCEIIVASITMDSVLTAPNGQLSLEIKMFIVFQREQNPTQKLQDVYVFYMCIFCSELEEKVI